MGQARRRTGRGGLQDPGRGCAGIRPKRGESPPPHRRASAWGAFGAGASVFKMIPPEGFSGVQPGVFLASEEPALPPGGPDALDAPCHPADLDGAELGVGAPESPSPSPVAGSLGRRRGGLGGAPYLQNDPVPALRGHVQSVLGHHLLSLPQRHVMELPVIDGEPQFLP